MSVTVGAFGQFFLTCGDCDQTFITYDPNAERGHPISLGDVVSDATRHAKECRYATPENVDAADR